MTSISARTLQYLHSNYADEALVAVQRRNGTGIGCDCSLTLLILSRFGTKLLLLLGETEVQEGDTWHDSQSDVGVLYFGKIRLETVEW